MSGFDVMVEAAALRSALAGGCYGRAGDLPIFRHALLRPDERLLVTSTDTQVERTDRLEAVVRSAEFPVCPDAQKLRGALTGIDGTVRLFSKDSVLVMTSGRRRFGVPCLPPHDFPEADLAGKAEPVACDGPALADALTTVHYATGCSEQVGTVTEGVLVEAGNVFATDGVRLAHRELELELPEGDRLVLPTAPIKPLAALLAHEGTLAVVRDGAQAPASVIADNGESRLVVRLLGRPYPDWRRLLRVNRDKQQCIAEVTLEGAQELRNVLARLKPFCRSKLPLLVFTSTPSGLSVRPMEGDSAEDNVQADVEGSLELCLNADFIDSVIGKADKAAAITWRCFGSPGLQEWRIDGREERHGMMSYRR